MVEAHNPQSRDTRGDYRYPMVRGSGTFLVCLGFGILIGALWLGASPMMENESIGKVKAISDFLPSSEELSLKDETVKVTIALSKTSVDFFKKEAKKYNTQY